MRKTEVVPVYLQELVVPPVGGGRVGAASVQHVSRHGGGLEGGGVLPDGRIAGHPPTTLVHAQHQQALLHLRQAARVHVAWREQGLLVTEDL